jgi:oligoendopeptidase F
MWAVKGHYYNADLSFYNYPYAFGLVFATALYARFLAEGPGFAQAYRHILRKTGMASCESVAREAGLEIGSEDFWLSGLAFIEAQVAQFERLAPAAGS